MHYTRIHQCLYSFKARRPSVINFGGPRHEQVPHYEAQISYLPAQFDGCLCKLASLLLEVGLLLVEQFLLF